MKALYKQGLRGRKVRQHFPDGMEMIPTATLIRRVYRIAVLPIMRNYCMGFTDRKCEDNRMTGKCQDVVKYANLSSDTPLRLMGKLFTQKMQRLSAYRNVIVLKRKSPSNDSIPR